MKKFTWLVSISSLLVLFLSTIALGEEPDAPDQHIKHRDRKLHGAQVVQKEVSVTLKNSAVAKKKLKLKKGAPVFQKK